MLSRIRLASLALLSAALAPATAAAQNATVERDASVMFSQILYTGSPDVDDFFVSLGNPPEPLPWVFSRQGGAQITPVGPDCAFVTADRWRCNVVGGGMTINLNGGDDFVSGGSPNQGIRFNGGPGADTIVSTGSTQNTVNGDGGADILRPVGGNRDFVNGGPGDDLIQGVAGPDLVHGDDGVDTLELSTLVAHSISLDGVANDGGSLNVFPDVENLVGGDEGDTLIGSAFANRLDGGKGGDIIDGGAGPDVLRGGEGDDTIEARDGAPDVVDCGVGTDTATIDPADLPVTGCETVRLPDDDLDGVTAPLDCDDGNPAIKPGAVDVPGDGIDQDCSGADTPLPGDPGPGPGPVVDDQPKAQPAGVRNRWQVGRRTKVVKLEVRDAPTGAKVRVRCKGRGCAFKRRTVTVGRDGKARLTPRFKGRGLKPGAVIEVRITAAGFNGKVVRYTVRKGKLPKSRVLCLRPGTSKPVASC